MAQNPKYLRQLKSGHIYHWTPQLAKKRDMVPVDLEEAEIRIVAAQKKLEELKARRAAGILANEEVTDKKLAAASANFKKLAEIEAEINTLEEQERARAEVARKREEAEARGEAPPEIPAQAPLSDEEKAQAKRARILAEDPEIDKIKSMTKQEIDQYLQENYGIKSDLSRTKLEDLREKALDVRVNRVLELNR